MRETMEQQVVTKGKSGRRGMDLICKSPSTVRRRLRLQAPASDYQSIVLVLLSFGTIARHEMSKYSKRNHDSFDIMSQLRSFLVISPPVRTLSKVQRELLDNCPGESDFIYSRLSAPSICTCGAARDDFLRIFSPSSVVRARLFSEVVFE